jgi:membrane-bound serine protease (ClpP class)
MPETLIDPNVAFLMLVVGIIALSWELHAPGMFGPGLIGVILVCAGAFGLWKNTPTWYGSTLILLALVLLAMELVVSSHGISGIFGAILLAAGAISLIRGPRAINPVLAIAVAAAVCAIAIFLGVLGFKARRAAVVSGVETLVGQVGVSRTSIGSHGMVLVRGEYWQARSDSPIPAGTHVSVQRVDGLTLYVKEA